MVNENIPNDVRGLHRVVRELIRAVNAQKVVSIEIHTKQMDVNGVAVPIPSTTGRAVQGEHGTTIVLEP